MPTEPLHLARGDGISGLAGTTFIHLIWEPPVSDGGLPISSYILNLADPSGVQPTETRTLSTATWAGPRAGYYLAEFGGVPLIPGQQIRFAVSACNGLGVANGGSGCGAQSSDLTLATASSVPGPLAEPTVSSINTTHLIVRVEAATYTGGPPIDNYQIRWRTKPATLQRTETLLVSSYLACDW